MFDPDAIGYCQPPKDTQFSKGKSGNPKGRPKKRRTNIMLAIEEAALEPVKIRMNGRTYTVTAQQAVILKLRETALSGDTKAAVQFVKLVHKYRLSWVNKITEDMFYPE